MCKKVMVRFVSFFVFLFVFAFISLFGFSSDSYAVSDLSYTLTSSDSSYQFCYQSACDGFKYALITSSSYFSGQSSTNVAFNIQAPLSTPSNYSSRYINSVFLSPSVPVILPLNFDSFNRISVFLENPSSWSSVSVTIVLTDTLPSDCSSPPSGSLSITENGTFDVSSYAQAVVDVPPVEISGDYHDDLISINNSILICGAICLVLYFFYCIYRILIKSTGGR